MDRKEIEEQVRIILADRGQVAEATGDLTCSQSLYDAGLTSHATVRVMLELEDTFDVEFPDELLKRSVFDQVETIVEAVQKLVSAG